MVLQAAEPTTLTMVVLTDGIEYFIDSRGLTIVRRFFGESRFGHKEAICIPLAYGIRKSEM